MKETIINTIPLIDATTWIFEEYANLACELQDLMPEDFESRAYLNGQMKGIKFVVDILSKTQIL